MNPADAPFVSYILNKMEDSWQRTETLSAPRWLIEVTTASGFVATAHYHDLRRFAEFRDAVDAALRVGLQPPYLNVIATRIRRDQPC